MFLGCISRFVDIVGPPVIIHEQRRLSDQTSPRECCRFFSDRPSRLFPRFIKYARNDDYPRHVYCRGAPTDTGTYPWLRACAAIGFRPIDNRDMDVPHIYFNTHGSPTKTTERLLRNDVFGVGVTINVSRPRRHVKRRLKGEYVSRYFHGSVNTSMVNR